jgi:hypothetical protein
MRGVLEHLRETFSIASPPIEDVRQTFANFVSPFAFYDHTAEEHASGG